MALVCEYYEVEKHTGPAPDGVLVYVYVGTEWLLMEQPAILIGGRFSWKLAQPRRRASTSLVISNEQVVVLHFLSVRHLNLSTTRCLV